jgi:hypothetical protein
MSSFPLKILFLITHTGEADHLKSSQVQQSFSLCFLYISFEIQNMIRMVRKGQVYHAVSCRGTDSGV